MSRPDYDSTTVERPVSVLCLLLGHRWRYYGYIRSTTVDHPVVLCSRCEDSEVRWQD